MSELGSRPSWWVWWVGWVSNPAAQFRISSSVTSNFLQGLKTHHTHHTHLAAGASFLGRRGEEGGHRNRGSDPEAARAIRPRTSVWVGVRRWPLVVAYYVLAGSASSWSSSTILIVPTSIRRLRS